MTTPYSNTPPPLPIPPPTYTHSQTGAGSLNAIGSQCPRRAHKAKYRRAAAHLGPQLAQRTTHVVQLRHVQRVELLHLQQCAKKQATGSSTALASQARVNAGQTSTSTQSRWSPMHARTHIYLLHGADGVVDEGALVVVNVERHTQRCERRQDVAACQVKDHKNCDADSCVSECTMGMGHEHQGCSWTLRSTSD